MGCWGDVQCFCFLKLATNVEPFSVKSLAHHPQILSRACSLKTHFNETIGSNS